MLPLLRFIVGFAVLLAVFGIITVAVSVALNIASANTVTLVVSMLLRAPGLIVNSCLDLLQHPSSMPPWVSYVLAAACIVYFAPPRVVHALSTVVTAALRLPMQICQTYLDYRLESDKTILALRKRVADLEAADVLPDKIKDMVSELNQAKDNVIKLQKQNKASQEANSTLQGDLEDALYEKDCLRDSLNARQRRKDDELHELEKTRLRQMILDQNDEIVSLKSKVDLWSTQNLHHDCSSSPKSQRERAVAVKDMTGETQRLKSSNDKLLREFQSKNAINHELESHKATLDNLKEMIQGMSQSKDLLERLAVRTCINLLGCLGVDLAELEIDTLQFDSYLAWARATVTQQPSPTEPVNGFRLNGTFLLLSGSWVASGDVWRASEYPVQEVNVCPQTLWATPEKLVLPFSNLHITANTFDEPLSTPPLQDFQLSTSSTQPFGSNTQLSQAPTGFGVSTHPATNPCTLGNPEPEFESLTSSPTGLLLADGTTEHEGQTYPSPAVNDQQDDFELYFTDTYDSSLDSGNSLTPSTSPITSIDSATGDMHPDTSLGFPSARSSPPRTRHRSSSSRFSVVNTLARVDQQLSGGLSASHATDPRRRL